MSENKSGKYLKYAIGEIVLVVIGILIALQINNWNERRLQRIELIDFLKKIEKDISSDIKSAEEVLEFRDSTKYYSEKFFDHVKRKNLNILDFDKVLNRYYNPLYPAILDSNTSGYNSLINSGLLGKMDNPKLENSIFDYYELIKETERMETAIRDGIDYEGQELFGDVGTIELYDYFFNAKASDEKQNIWFKNFIKNKHLSNLHFANLDDIGLQLKYKEVIKQGNYIVELLKAIN